MTAETLDVRLLGPLELRREGEIVQVRGGKPRALLALLALHAGESVERRALVRGLWPAEPPRSVENALHVHVAHLREDIAPNGTRGRASVVATVPAGYALRIDPSHVDVHRFEELLKAGERALARGDYESAVRELDDALALWRGPALADFRDDAFARPAIVRLEDERLHALEEKIAVELSLGRHAAVVGELESLVARHPFRERLWEQLMLALYRDGRQAEALAAYRTARRALLEGYGLEPGRELRRLEKAILRQDRSLEGRSRRRRPRRSPWPATLPVPKTSFVGREEEVASVAGILARDARLITLCGPGGVGKTRLALEAARVVANLFPGGVFLVPLATRSAPEAVPVAILQALGTEDVGEPFAALCKALAGKRALLILDSFEHLLPAAELIDDLLTALEDLTICVTSRASLGMASERVHTVPPLTEADAVALFKERAKAASAHDDRGIVECCRRLDGLPLAIELAAARTRVLTPPEIAQRLGHRLDLLKGGPGDAPVRHRSLRATLEWSYDLLNDEEQGLFARLGVFAGGWTLEAAESLIGSEPDLIDGLTSLLDKHLIERVDRGNGESRYRMLDTVREYADELLRGTSELVPWQRRHAEFYVALVVRAKPELRGPDQQRWLDRLGADYDNIRAALEWALEHDPDLALRGTSALTRFWLVRGLSNEGREWAIRALRAPPSGDRAARAAALRAACALCLRQDDYESASRYGEEGLALLRELGDPQALPLAMNGVAIAAAATGSLERARDLYDEALDILRSLDDPAGLAVVLGNSAYLALNQCDYGRARSLLLESLALAEQVGDKHAAAVTLCNVGVTALCEKNAEEALRRARESIETSREIGFTDGVSEALATTAGAFSLLGEAGRATRLLAASEAILERTGANPPPFDRAVRDRTREEIRSQLGPDAFAEAWAEGERLEATQAAELALSP